MLFDMPSKAYMSKINVQRETNSGEGRLKSKTDMLRSIGKQSGESVESVREKKRLAMAGKICGKGKF